MTDRAFHYVEFGYNNAAAAYSLLAAPLHSLKAYSFAFTQTREIYTRGRERIDPNDVHNCWLHLFSCWRRLGVPFIDPRGLGAVGIHFGRQYLLSVRWRTGQSDAPSDSPVNYSRTPPNLSREWPVHRSSAWRTGHCPVHHRTIRCARLSRVLAAPSQDFLQFFSRCF
jgi:hypothetical protein